MVLSLFLAVVFVRALIGFVQHMVASALQVDFLHHTRMNIYKPLCLQAGLGWRCRMVRA
jgi:hypothetical protein